MMLKKLFRTIGKYRAQFISMIIMVALGLGIFVGFNMEWYNIDKNTSDFLNKTNFSDFRIMSEKGFSADDLKKISQLDGVDEATRYLSVLTQVENSDDKISLTVTENEKVSFFLVTSGESYDKESKDGIWISDRYAEKNNLKLNDEITLQYKNINITGKIKGLIKSGEYMICVPDSTQLMPDFETYGFAFISPAMLKNALGTEFYTQINVLSDLNKKDFTEKVTDALGQTLPIVSKDDTISYSEAHGESEEGKTFGSILPVIFLTIAILTMVTTMHRITASEKTQIGTLKALGFHDSRITFHYSSFALIIGIIGTILGIAIGYLLCWFILNPKGAMGTYIDMDSWGLHIPTFVWIVLAVVDLFLLMIGFLSVRSMLKGTAADALRPYTPKKMRNLLIEKLAIWKKVKFGSKWNLRDSLRHKARSAMTLFGIIGCMILLVSSFGIKDSMDDFIQTFYNDSIKYANRVNLDTETITKEDIESLTDKYKADRMAKSAVQIDGDSYSLEIYNIKNGLVQFINSDQSFLTLQDDGVYICERIARKFNLKVGDSLTFSPYGEKKDYTVKVAGIMCSLTESIALTENFANKIDYDFTTSVLFTNETSFEQDSRILNTQSKQAIMDSFDTFMEIMLLMIFLLVIAAVILGIVVLYNLGVMSYTERYREMATLKVIGFKDSQIGKLLISQNIWLTVIGIIIGIPSAIGVLKYLIVALASDYELSLYISWKSYLISILITFGVSLVVGLMISRKNKKIDMVEALKIPE
ncbi:MAG: ABC transporter permease [Clostridiales bacterium]|nr:ABC transporter permease [Clostridiales bacterium]